MSLKDARPWRLPPGGMLRPWPQDPARPGILSCAPSSAPDKTAALTKIDSLCHDLVVCRTLSLDGCRQVACIDAGLKALHGLAHVAMLNLQGCVLLTDEGLANLAHLTSLVSVNLQDCKSLSGALLLSRGCGAGPLLASQVMIVSAHDSACLVLVDHWVWVWVSGLLLQIMSCRPALMQAEPLPDMPCPPREQSV